MDRLFILLVIFGLSLNTTCAQLDPKKLTHFQELDGNLIHDIITDQQGILWIATQNGLMTFDGIDFTRYHPIAGDTTTIGTVLTTQLFMDDDGNIWIGCMYDLYKYNPKTRSFKQYPHSHLTDFEESRQPIISSIDADNYGRIYFGVNSFNGGNCSNGLIFYDEFRDTLRSFPLPDGMKLDLIYGVEADINGNVWVIANSGYFKINKDRIITPASILNDLFPADYIFLNGFEDASNGNLWVTSNDARLFYIDPMSGETKSWSMRYLFEPGEYLNYGMAMETDADQNLWISSHTGLIRFNTDMEQFERFPDAQTDRVRGDFINSIHIDSFNNLWIGLQSAGMLKFNDKKRMQSLVHPVNEEEGLMYGWAQKIIEQKNGDLWLATFGGIHQFDPETNDLNVVHANSMDPNMWRVNVIIELAPGRLLLHTNLGIGIYSTVQNVFRRIEKPFIPDSLNFIVANKDRHEHIWVGTSNGIYVVDTSLIVQNHFDMMDYGGTSIASNLIADIMPASGNDMWISTNDGLYLFDGKTETIHRHVNDLSKGDVIDVQDINSLYLGPDGIVWIGTWLGGLCRYNPETGKVRTYTISDGLPSMSIQGILGDEKNNTLWLSTFAGLSRFDIDKEKFNNYSLDDGMQGLLYSDGSYFESSDGWFLFGGNNGFTYFRPEEMTIQSTPPNVFITKFKVGSQSIDLLSEKTNIQAESITLSHNQNNLSFNYNGIQYDNPTKNKFRYTLENYDDAWREVGNIRAAFYYNLPPGKYTFRVIAANSNDVWNENGASVSFVIEPPWWKTWWAYTLFGILIILGIITLYRIQRKRLLAKQKQIAREKELAQAKEIEKAYHELKKTQSQLVHAEKMASLGELTAGIAHEIQNPLNFVNNFSEVNSELIDELDEEIDKGDLEEIRLIAKDIAQNEQKIIHHGRRADAIVKNMLQHSRGSGEEKIPTDINALADEYLRLSYHGLRAKDKTFNADFKTELDPAVPKVKVVPQDIGRVLLNIINNAFHACAERSRNAVPEKVKSENGTYKPLVIVTTVKEKDQIVISVKDNGSGIPDNIREKIFQPFFTTKPSGEGTGLGLSLSFDIVTKGHGGTMDLKTKEGEGTEFIIQLPVNK